VQSLEEEAAEGGFVASHGVEGAAGAGEVLKGVAEPIGEGFFFAAGGVRTCGAESLLTSGTPVQSAPEQAGLGAREAPEAPFSIHHLADEDFLDAVGGLEGGAEGLVEGGLLSGILAGENLAAGGEAVDEGVEPRAGFAFRGARAGGFLSVPAVGELLFFGSHDRNSWAECCR